MPDGSSTMPDAHSNGNGNGSGNASGIGIEPRHDWTLGDAEALFALPFTDLIYGAQRVHRAWHQPNTVQMSTLLSIKTGGCPEDCAY
jgi:biotin synthase-like enzyme